MENEAKQTREYQGHHCRNCWNVALWIGNDEGLYCIATEALQRLRADGNRPTLDQATTRFLRAVGSDKTADGGRYTRQAVRAALAGLEVAR